MKKFLLSCCLALGIGASAQYSYVGDFENPGYSTTIYKQFGGGSQLAAASCNGSFGGRLLPTSTIANTGYMIDMSTLGQTGNGQKIDVSVNYKKLVGVAGTLQIAYFIYDSATALWSINLVGSPVALTNAALTTCTNLAATVPAGAVQPGDIAGVGAWFVRSGTANAAIYLDDIILNQDASVVTAPACSTITNPVSGSTINAGNVAMAWSTSPTAVNYKVSVGTTPGASDVYSGTVKGTSLNLSLAPSAVYYAKVVASNLNGDATGCTEITFTTNSTIAYCGGIIATSTVYPISSVGLNATTYTSSAATGAPAYEDLTSSVFTVRPGMTHSLNVVGTGLTTNIFGMTVFIDWNNDGDFNDASEKYFQTLPYQTGTGSPINFNTSIAVPAGTTLGAKRMRVKYNFNGSTTSLQPALSDPCANMSNGQTEDYSINVATLTAAPTCTTITAPSTATFPQNGLMTWAHTADVTGYKVYIGTTPGGTDVVNGTLVTTNSYQLALNPGTLYYAKIVPTNSLGDAAGCTEISFTTTVSYCTASATSVSTLFEKINNVTFAGINNNSTLFTGYSDYTSLVGNIRRDGVYSFSATGNANAYSGDILLVWIDYNQDGTFDTATELVYTSPVSAGPYNTSITVPSGAKLGNTRMRVRLSDSTAGHNALPCGTSTYGEVEDYTVNIDVSLATVDTNKNTVALYPNPFKDVLKISDVKGVKSISISDVSGRLVKTVKASAEIQVSELKTGLYIVNLHMEDGSVKSIKAIKK